MIGNIRILSLMLVLSLALQELQAGLSAPGFRFLHLKQHRHRHHRVSQYEPLELEFYLADYTTPPSAPLSVKQKTNNLGRLLKQPVLGYKPRI
ncbi:hypothetical protein L596_020514 [Steinernema carpocapsae]|uniref:Uncharacterized protein n=1 Tax=Steinernema carpocapsae TaxID=34508 RepID=A0A4U5MTY7_STECR|nr:hypothetical protein L596_020514 [Steinernema carpocapsae]